MPRYSDHWPTNTRPAIGLGHDRRAPAESYGQPQPVSAWESSTQNYGTGSAYGSNQQQSSWRVCLFIFELFSFAICLGRRSRSL
jgi:hypothetical protein